jgi:hypothetical protein
VLVLSKRGTRQPSYVVVVSLGELRSSIARCCCCKDGNDVDIVAAVDVVVSSLLPRRSSEHAQLRFGRLNHSFIDKCLHRPS